MSASAIARRAPLRAFSLGGKKRVRVLSLTPFYPSAEDPTQGGFVAEPLALMEELGVENQTIAIEPFYRAGATADEQHPALWAQYFCFPGNAGLASAGNFVAAKLMRMIRRYSTFDVIHAHAALPCGHAAAELSKRLSVPFVVSVHGLDAFFTRQAGTLFGNWCRRVAKGVYRGAETVVCISETVRREVEKDVRANTTVIYNGVNPVLFAPNHERASGAMVLNVGNLIPVKGHAVLLRSFARVAARRPEAALEIIGDGPEREKLAQLAAQLGIHQRVRFHGRRGRSFVAEAMRRCAVFALPSVYEGLGCVYLEAMASGKPVIGCFGQGIEEVIENEKTGMLVAPGSEDELADTLSVLLENVGLRRRMGEAARQAITERFTLTQQAQQLAEIYRRCTA
jgi:glycosyltransferase involved in cell wall biosynthesis